MKILIVDDELHIRMLIEEIVLSLQPKNSQPWEIFLVENGLEAIKIIREESPEIVITDYHMPGMNGMQVIKFIKENKPGTRIILITSNHILTADESLSELIDGFITKPFSVDDVCKIIKRALEE